MTYFLPVSHLRSNVADRIRDRNRERAKMVLGGPKLLFLLEPLGLIEPL